ncbi:oligopeptide/dipeptide ABC transporter ATP-binding protein [Bosea sp. BIWAKO-01]|uniref:oligopeptide/dipeptide ABC transporter ATP-binding protein n=1 Tax=Bosea sp. BIWAKO-01 TaxID=506668 RepID=UPI00085349A6|nr:oligopeptide/dipeptide ABC transporter ATP-binding protein [Bosea sp. BIWAKO-01]GAU85539.1 oligopeptide transport ATP-binding protein OppF [Bosea sp. BIWAKO-01]
MTAPILRLQSVEQLYTSRNANGPGWNTVRAVDGVDLDINEGETLAIVGESGSGKSTLAKLLLMLNRPTAGDVQFRGTSLASLGSSGRQAFRRQVQAVFQDPASSLNPRMTVERMLGYIVQRHELASSRETRAFLAGHLAAVGLNPPDHYLDRYPHQLSGGQQQRIAIARAMMLRPAIIIADEPLSSLDVSVQAQVLQLMRDLHKATNVGFVVISHDLGAMESIADRTAVMYRGRIVEIGRSIYERPFHPYTKLLLDARLSLDPRRGRIRSLSTTQTRAEMPEPKQGGCRFRHRCPFAIEICATADPALKPVGQAGTFAACHRAGEIGESSRPATAAAVERTPGPVET